MSSENTLCTFLVGPFLFGMPVGKVQEVLRNCSSTRVPLARGEVRGLMNLRGQIATTISLRDRMELPESSDAADSASDNGAENQSFDDGEVGEDNSEWVETDRRRESLSLIVNADSGPVALLVDEVTDVISVAEYQLEAPPATLHGAGREMILGAYKLEDRLLLLVDAERIVDITAAVAPLPVT